MTRQTVVEVGCWTATIRAAALGSIPPLARAIETTGSTTTLAVLFVVVSSKPTGSAAMQPRPGAQECARSLRKGISCAEASHAAPAQKITKSIGRDAPWLATARRVATRLQSIHMLHLSP